MKLSIALLFFSLGAQCAYGDVGSDSAKKGLEIAQKVDTSDEGFKDSTSNMEMVLKNRQGQESRRFIRNRTLEVSGDGDKSLVIFDRPRDVKGTAFLSFTHKSGPDDQWLYLPALKRVKRIASNNKAGPFMGSEFAYEDIASQEVEKYTYKFVKDEKCPTIKAECHLIERDPVDEKSGYSKQLVWINQNELRPEKIDFYDRKKTLQKTLLMKDYKKYADKHWRAHTMVMKNHQNGKETTLQFSDYKFKTGLSSRDFDKNALKRIR